MVWLVFNSLIYWNDFCPEEPTREKAGERWGAVEGEEPGRSGSRPFRAPASLCWPASWEPLFPLLAYLTLPFCVPWTRWVFLRGLSEVTEKTLTGWLSFCFLLGMFLISTRAHLGTQRNTFCKGGKCDAAAALGVTLWYSKIWGHSTQDKITLNINAIANGLPSSFQPCFLGMGSF